MFTADLVQQKLKHLATAKAYMYMSYAAEVQEMLRKWL
jgi:hypothetical protein